MSGNGPPTGSSRAIPTNRQRHAAFRAIRAAEQKTQAMIRACRKSGSVGGCSRGGRTCAHPTIANGTGLQRDMPNPSTHPRPTSVSGVWCAMMHDTAVASQTAWTKLVSRSRTAGGFRLSNCFQALLSFNFFKIPASSPSAGFMAVVRGNSSRQAIITGI